MSWVRIYADDAAQALAEVARRFGEDALIVSTARKNSGVEVIVAHTGDPAEESGLASPPRSAALSLPSRLVLIGPPGAGVSLLAARLAAEQMRVDTSRSIQVIAPRTDPLAPISPLVAHARLIGLEARTPNWSVGQEGRMADPQGRMSQIVDMSGLGKGGISQVGRLLRTSGAVCWLVLPTGLHLQAQEAILPGYRQICSALALTRADLCPLTLEDRALPQRFGLPIALVAQGTGLLDACQAQTLAQTMAAPYEQKDIPHVAARLSR